LAFLNASQESKATGNRKVMSNELKPELSSAYQKKKKFQGYLAEMPEGL